MADCTALPSSLVETVSSVGAVSSVVFCLQCRRTCVESPAPGLHICPQSGHEILRFFVSTCDIFKLVSPASMSTLKTDATHQNNVGTAPLYLVPPHRVTPLFIKSSRWSLGNGHSECQYRMTNPFSEMLNSRLNQPSLFGTSLSHRCDMVEIRCRRVPNRRCQRCATLLRRRCLPRA